MKILIFLDIYRKKEKKMNRYILIDLKDNVLYSLYKVEIDFEENEEQTSSVSCINKEDLIKESEEWLNDLKEKRICSECGREMIEGYCIENGLDYYCSDECLHKNMTQEEYLELYDDGKGDSYYTEWR
jgi:hypothetical protein